MRRPREAQDGREAAGHSLGGDGEGRGHGRWELCGAGAGSTGQAPPHTRVKGAERKRGPGGSKTTTWGPHLPLPPA